MRQPVAYVTRMVRNASIDACRRQSLENVYHTEEDDGFDVPSPEPTPEAALLTRDTLRRVWAALDDLLRAAARRSRWCGCARKRCRPRRAR